MITMISAVFFYLCTAHQLMEKTELQKHKNILKLQNFKLQKFYYKIYVLADLSFV